MAYAQKIGGAWTALSSAQPVEHDGIATSYDSLMLWTDEERAAFGVYVVAEGAPPPEGQRVASSVIGERNGRPVYVNTFEPIPGPDPVEIITMRQARLQLLQVGKLSAANQAIAAMPGQPGEEARVEWEYATSLRRDHPLVAALGRTLDLDEATIDGLFLAASQIA